MTDNGVKIATIRKRVDAHRAAIQKGDPVASRLTWDAVEDYIGTVFFSDKAGLILDGLDNKGRVE